MAYEEEMKKMSADIAEMAASFKASQEKIQADMMKMLTLMTAESTRNAKKFEVMDLRLNSTQGPSIHDENQRDVPNVREKFPEELTLTDLTKFTRAEDPLIHVKAFKVQMALKWVGKDYWHLVFPHSLGPNPQSWFYSLDNKKIDTWEEIAIAFTEQYKDNVETWVSIRTLEVNTQNENEGLPNSLLGGGL